MLSSASLIRRRCIASRASSVSGRLALTAPRQSQRQFHPSASRPNDTKKDTAFDPSATKPEEQKQSAAEEAENASAGPTNPAGKTVNKSRDPQEGGKQGSANEDGSGGERSGPSGGGSPNKAGGVKSGGGGH